MKKNTKIIALLFAGTLLTVGSIQAADHHNKKHDHDRMSHMFKKLDLNDSQALAIKAIKETQHAQKTAHRAQMEPIRDGLRKQVEADDFNLTEVRKLAHKKALLVEEMTVQRAQSMHQIHQQLTAEQRAKLAKMKNEKRDKMKNKQ